MASGRLTLAFLDETARLARMDHGRVRRELVVTVGIVAFIAIAIIKPWGGESGPAPATTGQPTAGPPVTAAPTKPIPAALAGRILETIPIAGAPLSPSEASSGLWYGGGALDLTMVDTTTGETTSIRLDPKLFPQTISMAADGVDLWLTGSEDHSLARLQPTTGEIVERIAVRVAAPYVLDDLFGITSDAGTLWAVGLIHSTKPVAIESPAGSSCCDSLAAQVLIRAAIDTSRVDEMHRLDGALAMAIGFGSVWVLESPESSEGRFILVRLDPRTGVPVATMGLPDFDVGPTGCGPCVSGVRIGADGVWLALGPTGHVIRIDPAQNRIVAEIDVGGSLSDLTVGPDGSVWAVGASASENTCVPSTGFVARISPERNELAGLVPVDCPVSVAVSNGDVWVGGYVERMAVIQRIRPTR